jgi:hypothetical protein
MAVLGYILYPHQGCHLKHQNHQKAINISWDYPFKKSLYLTLFVTMPLKGTVSRDGGWGKALEW